MGVGSVVKKKFKHLVTDFKALSTRICNLKIKGELLNYTRVVPKVMNNFFFACELGTAEEGECGGRWNSCCVILECLVTPIACIT